MRTNTGRLFPVWIVRSSTIIVPALWLLMQLSAAAQEKLPPIKRLDPQRRVIVLATLAGLVILGVGMLLLTWLGARVTRRYMHGTSYFRPTPRPDKSDWSPQPLKPGDKLADEPEEEPGS